jgi:hypothetical protein
MSSSTMRTILLIGGPKDGTRTLACAAVDPKDLLDRAYVTGRDDDGEEYLYAIIGPQQNGELLAVSV